MATAVEHGVAGALEWAVAWRPALGEDVSGDLPRAQKVGAHTVVALADGLGHGPKAAASAQRAIEAVFEAEGNATDRLHAAHRALRGARGAALGVGVLEDRTGALTWAAVGNVEAAVVDARSAPAKRTRLFVQAGVIGVRMRPPRETRLVLSPGAMLVAATDGVDEAFVEAVDGFDATVEAARRVLDGFARDRDDATLLLARFRGGS